MFYPLIGISIIQAKPPNLQFIWMATLVAIDSKPRGLPPFGVIVRWQITCVGTGCWTQHFFLMLLYRSALLFGTTHMINCGFSFAHFSNSCVYVVWRSSGISTLRQKRRESYFLQSNQIQMNKMHLQSWISNLESHTTSGILDLYNEFGGFSLCTICMNHIPAFQWNRFEHSVVSELSGPVDFRSLSDSECTDKKWISCC